MGWFRQITGVLTQTYHSSSLPLLRSDIYDVYVNGFDTYSFSHAAHRNGRPRNQNWLLRGSPPTSHWNRQATSEKRRDVNFEDDRLRGHVVLKKGYSWRDESLNHATGPRKIWMF